MDNEVIARIVDTVVKQLNTPNTGDDITLDAAKRLIEKVKAKAREMPLLA